MGLPAFTMMNVFMCILIAMGLTLTIYSFVLAESVSACNVNAQNALRGLLTLGVILFTIPATLFLFKCSTPQFEDSKLGIAFVVFLLALGITTMGLVATIHKECENARKSTPFLLGLSILITIASIAYLGLKVYKLVKPDFKPGPIDADGSPLNSPTSSDQSGSSNSPLSLYGG